MIGRMGMTGGGVGSCDGVRSGGGVDEIEKDGEVSGDKER